MVPYWASSFFRAAFSLAMLSWMILASACMDIKGCRSTLHCYIAGCSEAVLMRLRYGA